MRFSDVALWSCLCALLIGASSVRADEPAAASPARQAMDDAWWTGPLLASSASTLPRGHFLFEPYLYDSVPYAHFDSHGTAHDVGGANNIGSQSYINYGLTDRLTVGLIPRFGFNQPSGGRNSSGIGVGDVSLQAQYRLTQYQEGQWMPTISLNVGETLPVGDYDHLTRASNGFGSGAYTTTLSLYSQTYFWVHGRILRTRLDLSYALSNRVPVQDMSVYGTSAGFRGHASPGDSAFGDLAFEYSLSRKWVLALDLWYERDGAGRLLGSSPQGGAIASAPVQTTLDASRSFFVAPALEYNWNSNVGVIFGARITAAGRNETAAVTPVVALDIVH